MASSINKEKQLEEKQPKEEEPINGICQEQSENVDTNGANLAKWAERMDKESTNLPPADRLRHRKLPAELNHEIFYRLNLATRRKFIWGLGWDFYAMFRQILLMKSKRLRNPQQNAWRRSNVEITISDDGLNASKTTNGFQWQNVYAEKGFPISVADCRMDDFPGTICYYFEVKILKSALWYEVGLSGGHGHPFGRWIGQSPNSYAIHIPIPFRNIYHFRLAGRGHHFEFPEGVIRQTAGNVVGSGILMDPNDKLTVFFTVNGILIDSQFPIDPTVDYLFPTAALWDDMSLEANFGDNPAEHFEYDIKKCPGMGLEWI